MTEIYKYILRFKNTYNLTNAHLLESQSPRAKRCALNCIANRASQILQTFPIKIKDSFSLKIFKQKIKRWYCNSCPCCKPYIHHLGFT